MESDEQVALRAWSESFPRLKAYWQSNAPRLAMDGLPPNVRSLYDGLPLDPPLLHDGGVVAVKSTPEGANFWVSTIGEYRRVYVRLHLRLTLIGEHLSEGELTVDANVCEATTLNNLVDKRQALESEGYRSFDLEEGLLWQED